MCMCVRAHPTGHAQAIHIGKKEAKFVQLNEYETDLDLVSKELNHLAAILHVYAGGLNFMK